jgi:hypothetical protein
MERIKRHRTNRKSNAVALSDLKELTLLIIILPNDNVSVVKKKRKKSD